MNTNTGNLTEKVSVNINTTTLAAIDLLIDNGHYFNRSDFINQALREAMARNEANLQRALRRAAKSLRAATGSWACPG